MSRVILFGATSEIGQAILKCLPEKSRQEITLVGSSKPSAGIPQNSKTNFIYQDWSNLESAEELFSELSSLPEQDLVIISLGYASSEEKQTEVDEIKKSLNANLLWPLLCLEALASNNRMNHTTQTIFISSSLASLPTTSKSFVYTNLKKSAEGIVREGFTKGEFKGSYIFLRPGFVPTKLNSHLAPGSFPSTPDEIAKVVIRKLESGKANCVLHAPRKISIMAGLSRAVPEPILRRILESLQR